jgi:hypothetical protein
MESKNNDYYVTKITQVRKTTPDELNLLLDKNYIWSWYHIGEPMYGEYKTKKDGNSLIKSSEDGEQFIHKDNLSIFFEINKNEDEDEDENENNIAEDLTKLNISLNMVTGLIHRMFINKSAVTKKENETILNRKSILNRFMSIITKGLLLQCPDPEGKNHPCLDGIYTLPLTKCTWDTHNLQDIHLNNNKFTDRNYSHIIFVISSNILDKFDYYINPIWSAGIETHLTTYKNKCRNCKDDITNKMSGIDRFILARKFDGKMKNGCIPSHISNSFNQAELIIKGDIGPEFIQEVWIIKNNSLFDDIVTKVKQQNPLFLSKLIKFTEWEDDNSLQNNFNYAYNWEGKKIKNTGCRIYRFGNNDGPEIIFDPSCSKPIFTSETGYTRVELIKKYLKYKNKYFKLKKYLNQ